ncbi:MAG: hypothetical protein V7642_4535, partial [Burkholderiales bacterium]
MLAPGTPPETELTSQVAKGIPAVEPGSPFASSSGPPHGLNIVTAGVVLLTIAALYFGRD